MAFKIEPNKDSEITLGTDVDTLVDVLLDGSWSMKSIRMPTISGVNEYINGLPKSTPNSTTLFSLNVFRAGELTKIRAYENIDTVRNVTEQEYEPNGGTPLLASIFKRIRAIENVLKTSPTPPAVLFVIMTDGEENGSHGDREFMGHVDAYVKAAGTDAKKNMRDMIKELIEAKTADGWNFIFLGANQDAFHEGAALGIASGNTVNFAADASKEAFATVAMASSGYVTSNSMMRSSMGKSVRYGSGDIFKEAGLDNKVEIKVGVDIKKK